MPSETPIHPRKRPSQKRAEVTCEAVVEAAAHILESEGASGLTTNKIAERAGVSIGSLYQYFPNKEAIVIALAKRETVTSPNEGSAAAAGDDGKTLKLRPALRAYLDLLSDKPQARRHALVAVLRHRSAKELGEEADQRFRAFGAYDGLSEVEAFVVSRAITGVVRAAVLEGRTDIQSSEFEETLTRLAAAFIKA